MINKLSRYWQDKNLHSQVWRLAWPMILSNITLPLLGLVDTAVMGHLDHAKYMGAVSVGTLVIGFVVWLFVFLRMGTTGFAAQALGKNDNLEINAIIWRSIILAVLIALPLVIWQEAYINSAFYFIPATPEVEALSREYFYIRIWGMPASIASFAIVGWFIGLHNTKIPLLLLVSTNTLNIILDLVFVIGLDWKVEGAAYASLISEYLNLSLGVYFILRELKLYPAEMIRQSVINLRSAFNMLAVNRDIFIRTIALQIVFFVITAQGAKFGNDVLAANSVLLNFLFLIANGLDGLAQAVEAMVGRAIGAKDRYSFYGSIIVSTGWSFLMSLLYIAIFGLLGHWIIGLLTNIDSVRETAFIYLPWLIFLPINGVWSYLLDGIFVGATRAVEMRNSMLAATLLGFIPSLYFFESLGNHGLWLSFHIFMILRALILGWYFWKLHKQSYFFKS